MGKVVAIAAALLTGAGALSACGGEDPVSPDEYVGALCGAAGNYTTTLLEGQAVLQDAAAGDSAPAKGKAALSGFFGDAASAADEAASQIGDAGVPDVENGEQIADALVAAFDDVAGALSTARDEVEALPTDSPASFRSAAEDLATSFQEDISSIGEGLSELGESPELESAAQSNEECTSLQSGISPPTGAGANP